MDKPSTSKISLDFSEILDWNTIFIITNAESVMGIRKHSSIFKKTVKDGTYQVFSQLCSTSKRMFKTVAKLASV